MLQHDLLGILHDLAQLLAGDPAIRKFEVLEFNTFEYFAHEVEAAAVQLVAHQVNLIPIYYVVKEPLVVVGPVMPHEYVHLVCQLDYPVVAEGEHVPRLHVVVEHTLGAQQRYFLLYEFAHGPAQQSYLDHVLLK